MRWRVWPWESEHACLWRKQTSTERMSCIQYLGGAGGRLFAFFLVRLFKKLTPDWTPVSFQSSQPWSAGGMPNEMILEISVS